MIFSKRFTQSVLIIGVLACFVGGKAFAQLVSIPNTPQNAKVRSLDPTKVLSSFTLDTWTVQNGLPLGGAKGICQTDDGYIWLSLSYFENLSHSITRFDGRRFQTFRDIPALKHTNSSVGGIVAGRGNRLWCVCFSLDTVFLCKLQSGQWQTFSLGTVKDKHRFKLLPDKKSAEVLWMIMDNKLVRFENGKTVPITSDVPSWSSSTFRAIAQDSSGNLYAAGTHETTKGSVENILYCLHDARVVKTYTQTMGLISYQYDRPEDWQFFLETHGNDLWIVNTMYDYGKRKYNNTIQRLHNGRVETLAEVPKNETIVGVTMSSEGVLYLQLFGSGIYRFFDGQGDILSREEVQKYFISPAINACLMVDKEGALWTCTGSWLSRIRNHHFTHFDKTNGLLVNNRSWNLMARGKVGKGPDSLLLASNSGIIVIHKGGISTVQRKDGLLTDTVSVLAKDSSGQVWVGLKGGLQVLQNGKLRSFTKKDGLVNDTIIDIMTDKFGRVWITSRGRIQVYQHATNRFHTLIEKSKTGISPWYLECVDKSHYLWFVGAFKKGKDFRMFQAGIETTHLSKPDPRIVLYKSEDEGVLFGSIEFWRDTAWVFGNGDTLIQMTSDRLKKFPIQQGEISGFTVEDNQTMWIVTSKGLVRFQEGTMSFKPFEEIVPNDMFYNLVTTRDGYVWILGEKKMYRLRSKDLHDFFSSPAAHTGSSKRLVYQEYTTGIVSGYRAEIAGNYLVTRGRFDFSVADLRDTATNTLAPAVIIEEARTDSTDMVRLLQAGVPKIELRSEMFHFRYTATSLFEPEKVQFQYKLEGYDKDWIEAGTRREAEYMNLKRGRTYTFRVKACNNDGVWNEQGASLEFYLIPFWYETWWFYSLCGASALAFGFVLYKQRVKQLQQRAAQLERTVKDRTKELYETNEELNAANDEITRQMEVLNEQTSEIELKNTELHESLENLRRTQTQLAQAEKMASLGTLVAGVAHELNTPIGVAVTAASTLDVRTKDFVKRYQEGGLKKSELDAYVQTAQTGADITLRNLERAANLIQSFKQVAVDQTTDNKRRIGVKSYIAGIITSLEPKWKTTRHRVELVCDETLEMETYPGAIAQIITNLIDNSLLHGFQGYTEEGIMRITVEHQAASNQVNITYSDNGRGIPQEVLPRIFDPFFTTKQAQGGTGLGMHIVYNLVTQKLGGEITCSSQHGIGTTFIITLAVFSM